MSVTELPRGRTALLVMDVQRAIVRRVREPEPLLDRVVRALDAARAAGLPVVYVQLAYREGYPEVNARNKFFSRLPAAGVQLESDPDTEIHPDVAPRPGEPVVRKLRVSAFAGTDLAVILGAQGVDTIVLAGIATSGVVVSTVRDAADRDYGIVVLSDACADTTDDDVHRVLMEQLFPRQADVMTVDEWAVSLSGAG